MTPVETIDCELAKLSTALHAARMAENHARARVLVEDVDDLLDRRLALRAHQPR